MDGFNERVRYTLTSGVKAIILKAYPSVKQEQLKFVPNRMTEEDSGISFFFLITWIQRRGEMGKGIGGNRSLFLTKISILSAPCGLEQNYVNLFPAYYSPQHSRCDCVNPVLVRCPGQTTSMLEDL